MRHAIPAALILSLAMGAAPSSAVNCCYVDDPGKTTCIANSVNSTNTIVFPGSTVCGHTVEGSNCILEILNNQTGSGGSTCLTLGRGVTVDMNNTYSFTCSAGTKCATAIKINDSAGSANKVIVSNGTIAGCWTHGISQLAGTNASAENVTIDLAATGSCPGDGDYGAVVNTVSESLIKNASVRGVSASLIEHSIVRDNAAGVLPSGGTIDNSLIIDNDYNIRREVNGLYLVPMGDVTLKSSAVQSADTCDCAQRVWDSGLMQFVYECVPGCDFLSYTGDPSFVGESIH